MTDTDRADLTSPVTVLSGVGKARAEAYAAAGVYTLEDLLYYVPRAYENRGEILPLAAARCDGKSALVLTACSAVRTSRIGGARTITKFRAYDESGTAEISFFNQPYLNEKFVLGSRWRFYGRVERRGNGASLTSPVFEPWAEGELPNFAAVYPLHEGLTQKAVAANALQALRLCRERIKDPLPNDIRTENALCTLAFALRNIHLPESYEALAAAKRRLVFDELFTFTLAMSVRRGREKRKSSFVCKKQNISELQALLPYELTGAQKRAVREIAGDMRSGSVMSRIVVGDVGCGKTVVAASAIYIALLNGAQAALMAPTEILARQHFAQLEPTFSRLGFKTDLLVGSLSAAEKKSVKAHIASGETRVAVGTHALITADVRFESLGLAVTDEQHRFGVDQRASLARQNENVHVLSMSATPIPRSLALAVYGDTDLSLMDELPPNRQKVATFVVDGSYRDRLNAFILRTVEEGGQVYAVCPAVEESSERDGGEIELCDVTLDGAEKKPPLRSVTEYAESLGKALPGVSVAVIHGRMRAEQKDAIMSDFVAGKVDVLVSTTVIEVGVNVPNASLMIVENAERFGLSQLHQLRGRVGRGARKSYCVLVSDDGSANARRRLSVMKSESDGFKIAQADLATRGPGDFFAAVGGTRQSGGVRFRFADLCGDASLFAAASKAASALVAEDPSLSAYPELQSAVRRMTGGEA